MNMLTDTDTDTDLTFYSYILLLYYVVSMQHAVTSHKSQVTSQFLINFTDTDTCTDTDTD